MWKVQIAWRNDKTGHHKLCHRPIPPNSCCSAFDWSCSKSSALGCNMGDNSPGVSSIVSIYFLNSNAQFKTVSINKIKSTDWHLRRKSTDSECLQKYIWINKTTTTQILNHIQSSEYLCVYIGIYMFNCCEFRSYMSIADLKRALFSYNWFDSQAGVENDVEVKQLHTGVAPHTTHRTPHTTHYTWQQHNISERGIKIKFKPAGMRLKICRT